MNTDISPAQRQTVVSFLQGQRHPPPGAWTDNRLGQAQHYTGAIYLALSAISEALASAAVWVEQRRTRKSFTGHGGAGDDEDYTPLRDHPLSEIVQFPNPNESFSSILGYLALQWGLTGNAPVWFVPGASHDRPVELYPLPEAVLQPVAGPTPDDPDGAWLVQPYYPTGWAWSYGTLAQRFARAVVLPGREVKKLRAPHPLIRNDGYSPLTACGVQFDILEAIDQSRHAAMLQGAQLGTIVSVAGLAPDQLEQAAQSFRQRSAGPHNARSVLFVSPPPGSSADGFRVEQVGESPREMDYASSWEQATKFVLATFGVPPAIAGLQATTGYAEFYAAQIQFHYRISQLARRLADFFTLHLAGPWSRYPGEYRIKIEIPRPRNQDEYKQQMVALAAQGAVSVNELRAAFDLGPVRYGDLPPAIYTQKVQADEFPPPPQPAEGGDMGGMPAPAPAESPPADTPTGDAPPAPDNPEGEGSLPEQKARQVGEEWETNGQWYRLEQVGDAKIPVRIPPPVAAPDRDQPKKPASSTPAAPHKPEGAGSVVASGKVKPLDPKNPHGWHVVNSKGVSHLYYDAEQRTMTVRWKDAKGGGRDDRFVTYYDVSPELAAEIANAGSVGTAVIKKLRNDQARSWTANDAKHLLDPAILDPRIAEVLKRAKGKKDKALTQELQALLVPENEWTYGYAQQAGAAILSLIPKDRKNRLVWGTEYGAAFESLFTVTIDHGWVHHGETGAADSSSGQKTYTTADGVRVVLGIDFKTSKGEDATGSYSSTTGGLHQKVSFIDYDPGNPDHRANDTYAAHGVSPDHHRLLFHFAGVDVHGSGKKAYAFAYFRAKPGGGGYTQFRPNHDITYKGQTFRKGEPVPPDVLCDAPPKTLQSWGFNPLKHCMPIRIQGLQRPEDFVKDPALMQKLHAKMEEFVKLIPYEDYCKEMGIALSASAEKDIVKASLMGADGHRVAGTTPKTQEQILADHAAKKHKEAERAKKLAKKHKKEKEDALKGIGVVPERKYNAVANKYNAVAKQLAEKNQHIARIADLNARAAKLVLKNPKAGSQVIMHVAAGKHDDAEALLQKHGH